MVESNKDKRDYSNRTSFNSKPLKRGEMLVPVVLNDEMEETLKPMGLDKESNGETWHFPNGSKVPVVFIPIEDKPGAMENAMKYFNGEAERYIKHEDFGPDKRNISLDKCFEDLVDGDSKGFDPTAKAVEDDIEALLMVFNMLITDLADMNVIDGEIFRLHLRGYEKKDIIKKVDIGKGKSQAYEYIGKVINRAKDLFYTKYR